MTSEKDRANNWNRLLMTFAIAAVAGTAGGLSVWMWSGLDHKEIAIIAAIYSAGGFAAGWLGFRHKRDRES